MKILWASCFVLVCRVRSLGSAYRSINYPVSLAGHTLSNDAFYKGYLQQVTELGEKNVVVFVQDQLSIDEITRYGDVFNDESQGAAYKSLQSIMEEYESTYLPSVKEPVNAVDKLMEHFKGNVVLVDGAGGASDLELKDEEPNFIVVTLPKTTVGRKLQTLVQIDEIMGEVTDKLSKLGKPFYAVYTAKARAKVVGRELHHGRQLLEATDANYTLLAVSNCTYLYFTKFKLVKVKGNNVDQTKNDSLLTVTNVGRQNLTSFTCSGSNGAFEYTFPDSSSLTLTMKMNMSTHMRYWYIEDWRLNFTFTYNSETITGTDWVMENNRNTLFGVVPYANSKRGGKSYHCSKLPPIKQYNRTEKTETMIELVFTDFQLQFDVRNGTFADADDCVGFFTLPIWMGLITVLVLTLILAFGIAMLANINTMDRFDDPKGKSIQVTTAD